MLGRLPSLGKPVPDDEAEKDGENVYNYVNQIARHSHLRIQDSIYAGVNYVRLARYLSGPSVTGDLKREAQLFWNDGARNLHGTIHTYNPQMRFRTTKNIFTPQQVSLELQDARKFGRVACLIFLCGNPSPLALAGLAVACDLDPEFLRRHLSSVMESEVFQENIARLDEETSWFAESEIPQAQDLILPSLPVPQADDLTLPSLPSTSHNIVQLRYTSIGYSVPHSTQRSTGPLGASNSIIRERCSLGNGYVSVEQQISICVEYIPTLDDPQNSWLGKSSVFQSILEGQLC